ncbi:MAG: adenosylcobinamide amidohydrolase [Eubacteriales bacterium]|nr:adenosylcobinamide amidohydrolase [Eubacteriales bacterium]
MFTDDFNQVYRDFQLWTPEPAKSLANGDYWLHHQTAAILNFQGPRRVLSSSPLNGGIRDDLTTVFNLNMQAFRTQAELRTENYQSELELYARELSLDPEKTTGLGTAAWLERACSASFADDGIFVEARVSGGIERNAVAAGDRAAYAEIPDSAGSFRPCLNGAFDPEIGTLNIFLSTNAKLSAGALCKALITLTEAKSMALQDLALASTGSADLASGSGTDGVIIISDLYGPELSDCGTHSKFGEMLARAVRLAVRRSILVNTGATTAVMHSILARAGRYGITELELYFTGQKVLRFLENKKEFSSPLVQSFAEQLFTQSLATKSQVKLKQKLSSLLLEAEQFSSAFSELNYDSSSLIFTNLYLHLVDEYRKGLIEWGEALRSGLCLIRSVLLERWGRLDLEFKLQVESACQPLELIEMLKLLLIFLLLC